MNGKFITFEGAEGSGKSTQAGLVLNYLESKKLPVTLLREPGGVKISESIRKLLLDVKNTGMGDECETLLYMAARAQMVKEVLQPQLNSGKIVLCDRFLDSTIAYQGYGNGIDVKTIEQLGLFAAKGIAPDLTILFDIQPEKGLSRAGTKKDRIESRSLEYHGRVRGGYLDLAKKYPGRIKLIKVDADKEEIFKRVKSHIDALLAI
ncbi:MAG: dTMP kinase [Candidatus Omnitrophica bacterium]|nr:dTMP kinase [Candidatus Omnitrophota bacterium]MDE2222323.1 dTMP kinase [Candidatus Omnitrophota bacterium]